MNIAIAVLVTLAAALAAEGSPAGWATATAIGLPLALRTRWPISALAVVLTAVGFAVVGGVIPLYAAAVPYLALALALFTVGDRTPRRRSLAVLGTATVAVFAIGLSVSLAFAAGAVAAAAVPAAVGLVRHARRQQAAVAAAELASRAVLEERLRIARELHDIVSHGLSTIAVKAGVANHLAAANPDEATAALQVIETTSRSALADMRRALGVLRSNPDSAPELTPAAGLSGLPELAEQAKMAGVHVDLVVQADSRLPEGVQLCVYRIVQEALTNVVKHAAPARCRVMVTSDDREVLIEVTDDGTRPPTGEGGHGLIGMRERVMIYGGTITAAPRAGGGFAVSARLPVDRIEEPK